MEEETQHNVLHAQWLEGYRIVYGKERHQEQLPIDGVWLVAMLFPPI